MAAPSQTPRFSTDPSTKGFDLSAGDRWIYPENYPLRDYQYSIVQSALYHNTLVCLPTGLGKTFIAAVVMYNFWRWYPRGKIVFLAPTKPLVAQQIKACHSIMGIESEETIELTGQMDQKKRQVAWSDSSRARVVFATPQVFHNDLEKDIIPADLVKCIVVDEAHKALGKHSYCESIRLMSEKSRYFRILGLSATPGGKLDAVQDVIRNLKISRLELRDDDSPDITPYVNERKLDIILVGLDRDLEKFKERYIAIMDPHVRFLIDNHVIRGNTGNLTKGRIFYVNKEWHQRSDKPKNHQQLSKTLMILMTMYHAYELMIRHGLRAFYHFYQKHEDKFWLSNEHALTQLLEEINYFLGPFPEVPPQIGESFPVIPEEVKFGHGKFYKLRDLLTEHFEAYENKEEDTRAIVFVEFRDIVNEVYVLLLQSMPLLRPQKFVGQAGQKRREQKKALENFRSNKVNVLISTSVGEEGLDVGEVDLIVCFDISQVSPIRLVQRMGRTGRKRDGHIIVLVTDGKEHQTLKSSMARRDSLNNKVLHSSGIMSALYKESPRMVPEDFEPECRKTCVVAQPKIDEKSNCKEKTKEPKKPRKKVEVNKAPVPAGSQSLMKFFKRTRDEEEKNDFAKELTNDERPAASQTIQSLHCNNRSVKSKNVKLLTSDDAAVNFLTLCTLKKSQEECVDSFVRSNPYLPRYYDKVRSINYDIELPDLKILDCLKNLQPYDETNDREDVEITISQENYDFPSTQLFCADENHVKITNCLGDSRFEALLDDSSSDSERTFFQPSQTEKNVYPTESRVDWAENLSGRDFDDTRNEWPNTSNGKNVGYRTPDEKVPSSISESKNSGSPMQLEVDAKDSQPIKFGAFEELLNDDTDASCESNESATRQEELNSDARKIGVFEDLLDSEEDAGSEKYDSDATIDGLERSGAFEYSRNEISPKKSGNNDTDKKNAIDSISDEITIISSGDSTAPENTSSSRKSVKANLNVELISEKNAPRTSDCLESRIDGESDREITTIMEKSSTRPVESFKEESIDLTDNLMYFSQNSVNEDKNFFNPSEIPKHFNITGPSNSTPINPRRGRSSVNLPRQSFEALERVGTEKNSSDDEFVNTERSSRLTLNFVDASRSSTNVASRETPRHVKKPPAFKIESDEDIFGIDDILVDSDFEEEIIKIEKSAERDSSEDRAAFELSVDKNIAKRTDSIDPVKEETKKVVDTSVPLDVSTTNKSLVSSPRKSFRIELDLCERKNEIVILNSRKSERFSDFGSCDKSEDEPPCKKIKVLASNATEDRRTFVNPEKSDLNLDLDDCDWDSNDFEESNVASRASTSDGNILDSTKSHNVSANGWKVSENSSKFEITTGWLTTKKPKPRLSLSKKLSRNICNSLWSSNNKNRKGSPGADSDSENDFIVSRLETRIPEDTASDCFVKPDTGMIKRVEKFTDMSKPIRSIRNAAPLALRRGEFNRLEFKDMKKFSAPAKFGKADVLVVGQHENVANKNDRKVSMVERKFSSRDGDGRKRKRSDASARTKKRARVRSDFIDDEADVSSDLDVSSGSSGNDDDLKGFVSYTQNVTDHVDMEAHYLQTVRSPTRYGAFFMRKPKSPAPDFEIYSQPVTDEPNHYVNDSFCVDEHDDVFEESATAGELTRLEELELRLRSKKRKRTSSSDSRTKRKRKVLAPRDDTTSSEDETEKLRRQIQEESFALKNRCK